MKTADTINLKIPEKLYVGVQGKKQFNTEDPPLAFAVPYGDKRFTDSRSTVDGWAGYNRPTVEYLNNEDGTPDMSGPYGQRAFRHVYPDPKEEGFVIDNEFMQGFYFDKSVSRWQTSNKFFRINDPRGFQLEIDADNLGDILLNSHISKGFLVGEFKWTRYNGKAYLVRKDHPSLSTEDKPKVARTIPKLGDVVCFGQDAANKYVYCGKFYPLLIGIKSMHRHKETGHLVENIPYEYNNWHYSQREQNMRNLENQYEHVVRENFFRDTKGFHIYESVSSAHRKYSNLISEDYRYSYYRGYGTVTILEEDKEFKLPTLGEDVIHYSPFGYDIRSLNKAILFSSKKDLLAYDISKLNIYDHYKADRKKQYEHYTTGYYANQPSYQRYAQAYSADVPLVSRVDLGA